MCIENLDLAEELSVIECEYCRTWQSEPNLGKDQKQTVALKELFKWEKKLSAQTIKERGNEQ